MSQHRPRVGSRSQVMTAMMGVVLAAAVSAPVVADVFSGPGGAFTVALAGKWRAQQPEPDSLALVPEQAAAPVAAVLFAPAEIDPCKPVADQLTREIKEAPEDFPNARDFTPVTMRVLNQDCQGMSATFDGPGGQPLLGVAVVFPAGRSWHLGAVIGPATQETLGFARQAFLGIGPPRSGMQALSCAPLPAAAAGDRGALPEGWLMRSTEDGRAVQVFEERQPGALGELSLLPREGRGARAVLHQAFYAPLAESLTGEQVSADPQDSMAHIAYSRTVNGVALKGEAMVAVAPEDALFAHVCAPADQYAAKEGRVKELLKKVIGARAAGAGQTPPPPVAPAQYKLYPAVNRDGSVAISVPAGWKVEGADGFVLAEGPEGYVANGLHMLVVDPATAMLPAGAAIPPGMLASPYLPPDQAAPLCLTHMVRFGGGSLTDIRISKVIPMPEGPNWASLDMTWNEVSPTRNWGRMRVLAVVGTIPGMGQWLFFASLSAAPADKFEQTDQLLAAIVSSRRLLRSAAARGAGRGGSYVDSSGVDIIDQVIRNRDRSADINARKWSAYMRDEEPTVDDATGRARMLGNVGDLNRWMQDDPNLRLDNLRPMSMDDWHRAQFE